MPPPPKKRPPVFKIPKDGKLPRVTSIAPNLDDWLAAATAISDFIVWERPTTALAQSGPARWKDWNTAERDLLRNAFYAAWDGKLSEDPEPYPNLVSPPLDDHPMTVLHADVALQHYMESAAVSLVSQCKLPKWWSLTQRSDADKAFLLDSRSLFSWSTEYGADGYKVEAWVLPARPGYMRKFLTQAKILKTTSHLATVVEMVRWCGRLTHFAGPTNTAEMVNHWHYRGYMPVSRLVEGTVATPSPSHPVQDDAPKHYTKGCAGTTGFKAHVLRMVNLPVRTVIVCGHTLPHFTPIASYLSHGDDPYMLRHHPNVSPESLLIDQATFDAWFGPGAADPCDNVGRRAGELA